MLGWRVASDSGQKAAPAAEAQLRVGREGFGPQRWQGFRKGCGTQGSEGKEGRLDPGTVETVNLQEMSQEERL